MNRVLKRVLVGLAALFVAIQVVPYGRQHDNPPVVASSPWTEQRAEGLARASCYACHSNETKWPPHSYVAPVSWLVRMDVERGRDTLNFSDWRIGDAHEARVALEDGSMPPRRYTLVHPRARLSDVERQALIAALDAIERDERRGRTPAR